MYTVTRQVGVHGYKIGYKIGYNIGCKIGYMAAGHMCNVTCVV